MNDHRVVFDHREEVRQNLEAQVGLCRKIATITSDSGLAVEWNDFAAEMDALIQTIGKTNRQDVVQQAA
jgi:hypothetical protein